MRTRAAVTATVLAIAALTAGRPARAEDQIRIGKIDGERVFKEYKLYQKLYDELQEMGRKLLTEFDERKKKHPLLLDDEWNQLQALRQKGAKISPAEKQTYDRLAKLSDERDADLTQLEGLSKLDDKQQARWKELVAIRAQSTQMLQDHWERVQKQGGERRQEIEVQLTAEVRAAVKKVAEAKGLTIVLQADVVVFGGEDITDATLEVLNTTETVKPTAAGGGGQR